jgi:hypothetical protein
VTLTALLRESFGLDSTDSSSGGPSHRAFRRDSLNFFLRANPEFPMPRLRAARPASMLSRGDARPGTSKLAHHRNGHLTGVFAIYRFCLRDAAAVRNTCELMSP